MPASSLSSTDTFFLRPRAGVTISRYANIERWLNEHGSPGENLITALSRLELIKPAAARVIEVCSRNALPLPPLETLLTEAGLTWLDKYLPDKFAVTPIPLFEARGHALPFGGEPITLSPVESDPDLTSRCSLQTAGHYLLGATLGAGVGSTVRNGASIYGNKYHAVKLVSVNRAEQRVAVDRLIHGSVIASRLMMPSVASYYEVGWESGIAYMVMPLRRKSVQDLCLRQQFTATDATEVCLQAARILASIHTAGFAHGNIKPSNLFIGPSSVELFDLSAPAEALMPRYEVPAEALKADLASLLTVYGTMLAGNTTPPLAREVLNATFSSAEELATTLESVRDQLPRLASSLLPDGSENAARAKKGEDEAHVSNRNDGSGTIPWYGGIR